MNILSRKMANRVIFFYFRAMSDFENYDETSQNYDTLRHAIGSDVIAGMLPFYCNKPLCVSYFSPNRWVSEILS